jgi:1,4-alpha-glucan branching enzyme
VDTLIESLLQTRLHDPFGLLGPHREDSEWVIRVYEPHATQVALITKSEGESFKRIHPTGLFEWRGKSEPILPYRLRMYYGNTTREIFDPYQFPSNIAEQDLYLFSEGNLHQGYWMLGSHAVEIDGI